MKAIFQLESSVILDSGGGNLGGRNSNAGLSGPWGTVFYGQWDTPYKFTTLRLDAFYATSIAASNAIIGQPGFGVANTTQSGRVASAADATFDRRQGNSVQYWTPPFKGLSARFAYSANEGKAANEAVGVNPYLWSVGAFYENGPIYAALGYERHEDYFGLFGITGGAAQGPSLTNPDSQDTGYKAGVGYTFFKTTTVNLVAERLEYENDQTLAGALTEYKRNAYHLSALHKIGPGTIRASFTYSQSSDCTINGAGCNSSGLVARHYAIGYSHSFSKRTDVYALYTYIDNDDLASYNFGFNALAGAGVGSDPSGFGIGIRHTF